MSEATTAQERYITYSQRQATGVEPHADLEHVLRTDALIADGQGSYEPFVLQGIYESDGHNDPTLGNCVRRAIRELARVDVVNLPRWLRLEDLTAVSEELGLICATGQQVFEATEGEKIIVIYLDREAIAHAVVVSTQNEVSKIKGEIRAVIRMPEPL